MGVRGRRNNSLSMQRSPKLTVADRNFKNNKKNLKKHP